MLSAESKEVVRATLPAVGAAIGEITELFYRKLFAAAPTLETDLFNRSNQKQGDQQKALAGSIAAFATLQLEPDQAKVDAILSRIAHKHASLGIAPEQYNVVHKYLFEAIVEVLGEAVTPEVATAWDELYWLMANTLIAMEAGLYDKAGVATGDVWRTVVVAERGYQSADAVSFVLKARNGETLPPFAPGQYISVAVPLPDGARQIRQYSLASADRDGWRITVKRVAEQPLADGTVAPSGEVSNFLYDNLFEGDEVTVSLPFGDLTLTEDAPVLLVSAGIGCTPMIGILDHLAESGDTRPVSILHADRSAADHPHRAELLALAERIPSARVHQWYEDFGARGAIGSARLGRADLSDVELEPGVHAYLCGPLPFMLSMREALVERGVPGSNVHYEVFGPDTWQVAAS
ncbi:globin domain-containing protein [Rhodococcus sp. HNM0569]|uniref:globin domain-containing protein n=1 Tax=Rhodococcus sp. HNM0569 TaxID=2716340 RepID=UPI00146A831C|nr:globin domain-containing protein [Rhodococcus sp. HNM0569]NLU83252.1 hemin transporter [Rhodococcus sp. HNM0569]